MRALRRGWKRLIGVRRRARAEAELMEEIETHLALRTDELVGRGVSPEEARRRARLEFGAIDSVVEQYRDEGRAPLLENAARDLRFGWRSLRRAPGFTAAVVASIALGIAATTAIFSVADAVLLRPLPYHRPERLVTVSLGGSISAPLFEALRAESRVIERSALFVHRSFDLSGDGEPARLAGARVSAGLFDLLGVRPQLGRTFSPGEDAEGRERVVLISDSLWRGRFGGDPAIVGRSVRLDGIAHEVVGVMPPGFRFPLGPELPPTAGPFPSADLWRPMALEGWERTCGGCFNFAMLARLRPGIGPARARAALNAVARRADAADVTDAAVEVRSLADSIGAKARAPLLILAGAVGLALLIACANASSLLLARGLRRRAEIALRLSLGASRARIVSQLLCEAVLLATLAAAVAVPLAIGAVEALLALAPRGIPRLDEAGVDGRVLAFAVALTLVSALLFGGAPAVLVARRQPAEALGGLGARGSTARWTGVRTALVVAEVALSLVLVAASASLARSYLAVTSVPLGFRAERVLTLGTSLPDSRFDERRRVLAVQELLERCAGLPGVASVAAVNTLPLTREGEGWGLVAADHPNAADPRPEDWTMARARAVTSGYFRTLGIPLVAGRGFEPADDGRPVVMVSRLAARRLWPGLDAREVVGRRLAGETQPVVVGVVEDTRASGIDAELRPYLYVPLWSFAPEELALVVRTEDDPMTVAAAVRAEIRRIASDQPVELRTMRGLVADWLAPRRFQTVLMSVFGAFALAIAAVGIFGLLSYSMAQRRRELGLRVALGASRSGIVAVVARQAAMLALGGGALGFALAILALPMLRSLLYGIGPLDPWALAGCSVVLVATTAVAAVVPAWRAARLDPMACLRAE